MGSKCLLVTRVIGKSRLPVPPARTTPFIGPSFAIDFILVRRTLGQHFVSVALKPRSFYFSLYAIYSIMANFAMERDSKEPFSASGPKRAVLRVGQTIQIGAQRMS